MKQQQFYKYAALGLLVLNIVLIGLWSFFRPPPPNKGGRMKPAIEMMEMDASQHKQFLDYAEVHKTQMKALNKEQRELLKNYFEVLLKTTPDSIQNTNVQQALELEREKIELTFAHMKEVKSLLHPEQYAGFERFLEHALGIILGQEQGCPALPNERRRK